VIHRSVSTWQQPTPAPRTPERSALHETRYLPAERVYLAEVDPLRLVDLVIDNRDLDRPTLTRGR
jgi:uridine kinase